MKLGVGCSFTLCTPVRPISDLSQVDANGVTAIKIAKQTLGGRRCRRASPALDCRRELVQSYRAMPGVFLNVYFVFLKALFDWSSWVFHGLA